VRLAYRRRFDVAIRRVIEGGHGMMNRDRVREILACLDWSVPQDRDSLLRQLLQRNLALPNEFLSAIQPTESFTSPDDVVKNVPDVVWTIHAERESRAVGKFQPAAASTPVTRRVGE
jgi:hypothetical protein